MANTTLTPSGAALSLRTQALAIALAGALALNGVGGAMNLGIAPPAGATVYTGASAALAVGGIAPPTGIFAFGSVGAGLGLNLFSGGAGSMTFAGAAPLFGSGSGPVMQAGALSILGGVPSIAAGAVTPVTGGALFGGTAPTLAVPNITLPTATGALQVLGQAPTTGRVIVPVIGAVTLAADPVRMNLQVVSGSANTGTLALLSDISSVGSGIAPASGAVVMTTAGLGSPVIAASSGALTLNGTVPTAVPGSQSLAPSSATTQLTGIAVNLTLSLPAPPTANLVAGGYYPQVFLQIFIAPAIGTLTLSSIAPPATVLNTLVRSASAAGLLSGASAALGIGLNTSAGTLNVSGTPPVLSAGTVLSTSSGAMTFVGAQPTFLPGISLSTPAGVVVVSGSAPSVQQSTVIPVGALALSGLPPGLDLGIAPQASALALSGAASAVNGRLIISIPNGSLSLVPSTPVQGRVSAVGAGNLAASGSGAVMDLGMSALTGAVSGTGLSPTVSLSGLPLSPAGALSIAGVSPQLTLGIAPHVGGLQLASARASVNSLTTLTPIVGSISFGSIGSNVTQPGVLVPFTGAMNVAADVVAMLRTGFAGPAVTDMAMTGELPLVYTTTAGQCMPATADMAIIGQPAVDSLYTGDAYHIVTLIGPSSYIVKLPG
jgi:hypothetical protein